MKDLTMPLDARRNTLMSNEPTRHARTTVEDLMITLSPEAMERMTRGGANTLASNNSGGGGSGPTDGGSGWGDVASGTSGAAATIGGVGMKFGVDMGVGTLLGAGTACEILAVGGACGAAFLSGVAIGKGLGVDRLAETDTGRSISRWVGENIVYPIGDAVGIY